MALCADGKLLLASASQDKTLRIWSIQASTRGPAADAQQSGQEIAAQPSDLAQMIARQGAQYLQPSAILFAPSYALETVY